MTLERIRAAQSTHLDAVELTAWWSTTVLDLVTYADEVTLGEGTAWMTDLDHLDRYWPVLILSQLDGETWFERLGDAGRRRAVLTDSYR